MTILYFAYGSNMCTGRLAKRVGTPNKIGLAKLVEYDLRFHKRSSDGSGKADAYQTGRQEDVVWGVLFEFDETRKPCLDEAEGVGAGYNEVCINVEDEDGNDRYASAYLADNGHINPELRPYFWYKRFVVEGARQHGLPNWYIEQIDNTIGQPDSNEDRCRKNWAVRC